MAFSVKIKATFSQPGKRPVETSPAWWNHRTLLASSNFRKEIKNGFLDYHLVVDKATFIDIFLEQLPNFDRGVYAGKSWKEVNTKPMEALKSIIEDPDENCEIEILIFEWDSGM